MIGVGQHENAGSLLALNNPKLNWKVS